MELNASHRLPVSASRDLGRKLSLCLIPNYGPECLHAYEMGLALVHHLHLMHHVPVQMLHVELLLHP